MKEVIYQLYPTTWIGQESLNAFEVMKEHLARIVGLGVSTIWLSPFYPAGPDLHGGFGCDGGYDVADYCAIDPRFGTFDDFDDFVAEANRLGMKVIIDLVLNHTSTAHPWFQASREHEGKYADYYLWSEKDLGWNNQFNGASAFEMDEVRGEYYLHLFHKEQADLNWKNPDVVAEFQKIIDFWTHEHGVAGFRLDVPIFIAKRFTRTWVPRRFGMFAGLSHYYMRKEMLPIFHQLFDGRDLFIVAESGAPFQFLFNRLFAEENPVITLAFNAYLPMFINKHFGMIPAKTSLRRWLEAVQCWSRNPHLVVTTESHDLPRFTSQTGKSSPWVSCYMLEANPRAICIYQGQEIGEENPKLSLKITDYTDAQTIMQYEDMTRRDFGHKHLMKSDPEEYQRQLAEYRRTHIRITDEMRAQSRENARRPISLYEYPWQMRHCNSAWGRIRDLIQDWRRKE